MIRLTIVIVLVAAALAVAFGAGMVAAVELKGEDWGP